MKLCYVDQAIPGGRTLHFFQYFCSHVKATQPIIYCISGAHQNEKKYFEIFAQKKKAKHTKLRPNFITYHEATAKRRGYLYRFGLSENVSLFVLYTAFGVLFVVGGFHRYANFFFSSSRIQFSFMSNFIFILVFECLMHLFL